VGISVVNALSARVEVEIDRDGKRHAMAFGDGGELKDRLAVTGDAPTDADGASRTGTTVRFWPDGSIFDETDYRFQTLQERFQMMAFLNRGLEIRVRDQRPDATVETDDPDGWFSFKYDGGIMDFVTHVNSSKEALFQAVGYFAGSETIDDNPHEVEIAFQWNTGFNSDGLHSFANGISTLEGGMHEQGFRTAVTRTVNNYARDKGLLKEKDDNLTGEDIREGLTAIISARIGEPQFEGQTKSKLGNVSMRSLVEKVTNEKMAEWLEEHPAEGKAIITKATNAARARVAAADARKAIRSKSLLDGAGMPDKLKDCSAKEPERRELFIVEGDSAGGSAVRARDPETQAILPIRGKILNVERARVDKMLKNNEVQSLITAIGAGFADDFDVTQARYHKVILLADADVDGSHIRTLLLTFFFRQMRPVGRSRLRLHRPAAALQHEGLHQGDGVSERRCGEGCLHGRTPQLHQGFPAVEGSRRDGLGRIARHDNGQSPADPCCRSRSNRRQSPTRSCRSSWATTSNNARTSSSPTHAKSGTWTSEGAES
jgi:DNA gyrase subunit B